MKTTTKETREKGSFLTMLSLPFHLYGVSLLFIMITTLPQLKWLFAMFGVVILNFAITKYNDKWGFLEVLFLRIYFLIFGAAGVFVGVI
jgi:hypothetical protein